MHQYPFIFSTATRYRLQRHFTFWFCWWAFQAFLYSFVWLISDLSYWYQFQIAAFEAVLFLLPHMFLSYSLMYGVVPKMILKGKYVTALLSVLILFLATALMAAGIGIYLIPPVKRWILPFTQNIPMHRNNANIFLALLAGLRGAITIGGVAAAIKLMKYWYKKEQQNLHLQRENVATQLNLLKAQVHPHFLFNTLNNIYAHTQTAAPSGARLVLGLSNLLRHMLYEGSQEKVLLQKELKLLEDYMLLEQERYDDRLDIIIDIPKQMDAYSVAPLLLLPFVENCFKHGASKMVEEPWIHLTITIVNHTLIMKLANGKQPGQTGMSSAPGIGIANVKQRLALLYPDKHVLQVFDEEAMFVVHLKLELEGPVSSAATAVPSNMLTYAES